MLLNLIKLCISCNETWQQGVDLCLQTLMVRVTACTSTSEASALV